MILGSRVSRGPSAHPRGAPVTKTQRIARPAFALAIATFIAPAALAQAQAGSKYPGKTYLLPATLETTQWGWFDNAQAPVLKIDSGDTVVFETMMHSHNAVGPGRTIEEFKKLRTDHPDRGPHTLTGPVY